MIGRLLKMLGTTTSCALLLGSCGGSRVEKWQQALGERNAALRAGKDLMGVTVPVLRARGLEKVWGAPSIQRDGAGGYLLTYTDPRQPASRLMIRGMMEPLPKLSSPPPLRGDPAATNTLTPAPAEQKWREVGILGQEVGWFQESAAVSGAAPGYGTEGFSLKAPDGRKGHFRLTARHGGSAEDVGRWFGSVSF